MKTLITYSTRTGNTRRLADAIAASLQGGITLVDINSNPDPFGFDRYIHGFWVTSTGADEQSLAFLDQIQNQEIGLFGTMGANPDSPYGRSTKLRLKNQLKKNGNTIAEWFLCAGEIAPELIQWFESLPEGHPQYPTPERRQNWADAMGHPNEEDLAAAAEIFASRSH